MATRIAQRELRNSNAEILNRVEAGESFTVTRNGVPVADVTPHAVQGAPPMFPKTSDLVGRRRGADLPGLDPAAWLADIRESDVDDDPLNTRV